MPFPAPLVEGWTVAREFPEFDQTTAPDIPPSWRDTCWHNNAMPSVEFAGRLWAWIDYADPALSEFEERRRTGEIKRFVLFELDNGEFTDSAAIVESDEWRDILAHAIACEFRVETYAQSNAEQWAAIEGGADVNSLFDANMIMESAFRSIMDRGPAFLADTDGPETAAGKADLELWNQAVGIVNARVFPQGGALEIASLRPPLPPDR